MALSSAKLLSLLYSDHVDIWCHFSGIFLSDMDIKLVKTRDHTFVISLIKHLLTIDNCT